MQDDPRFDAYHLVLGGDLTRVEFEDELTPGTLVEVLRELSTLLADLADYYEIEGSRDLFEPTD